MATQRARNRIAATLLAGLIIAVFAWPATLAFAQLPVCVDECAGDPLDDVKKDIGQKVDKADDAAEPYLSKQTKVWVDEVKGSLGLGGGGGRTKPRPQPQPRPQKRTTNTSGGHSRDDFARGDALRGTAASASDRTAPLKHRALDPDRGRDLAAVGSFGVPEDDPMAGLFDALGESLQTFTFPLALTMLIVAFLVIQGRVDSRDPKLALAPVSSEQDFLSFS